mmetsp:Transcript_18503/g.50968  ORF Transcript_18503/g.50968 Transcript_18503/m.50968 type:complete len:299 (-) Transcript_18503:122-1018(-)
MARLCIGLAAAALVAPGCDAIRSQRGAESFLQVHLDDGMRPFCQFGSRGGFNGSVTVYVTKHNVRSFSFGVEDFGTQTEVTCKGPVPVTCSRTAESKPALVPSCEDLACECDVDISELQFVYMKKMMREAIPLCRMQQSGFRVLMIGLGGGALPEYLLSHCPQGTSVESIEYDPRVIDVATHFFGLRVAPGVNDIENSDGGRAVQARAAAGKKYDLVLVDCFQSEGVVPDSCRNGAFVSGVRAILKPGGTALQQVWAPQYRSTLSTYRQVFGEARAVGIDAELEMSWLIRASLVSESQ